MGNEGLSECAYCLGKEPESQWENNSTDKITEYGMSFRSATPYTTHSYRLAHQLIHKKYGFRIEMHDCVYLGDWAFKLVGPWPETKSAIAKLDAFIRYARRTHETRGRKAKTKEAKHADAVLFESQVVAAMVAILEIPEKITQKRVARKLWPTKRGYGDRMLREKIEGYGLDWDEMKRKAAEQITG